jgi:hypothetical protein
MLLISQVVQKVLLERLYLVGANATRGLSDAYLQANAQNASQDATAQQFNLGVDSSNVATRNRAIDEMRMDEAAYRGAKSKLVKWVQILVQLVKNKLTSISWCINWL